MSYIRANFAHGELASGITSLSTQMTVSSGHTLPTAAGTFVVVVWNAPVYDNPADDVNTEIIIASYSGTPNVYNITRGQEGTVAVLHSLGDEVALHFTAGVSEDVVSHASSHSTGGSDAVSHNNLGSIQGGTSGQYNHLTNAQVSALHAAVTLGTLTGITLSGQQLSLTTGYVIPTTTKESNWDAAYSASHARQHAITSTSDHTSSATAGKMLKADASGLPIDASNTDTQVAAAVTASHAAVTIPVSANGLVLTGQEVSLPETAAPVFGGLTVTMVSGTARVTSPSYPPLECIRTLTTAGDKPSSFLLHAKTTADMVDGFGPHIEFAIQDDAGVRNALGSIGFMRAGADNTGYCAIYVRTGGSTGEKLRVTNTGQLFVGKVSGTEILEVAGKVRADTAFNLNGTDGVTQAAAAGTVSDVTALAGGIATAQTQVTPIADGAHSLVSITSITTVNGRITAMA